MTPQRYSFHKELGGFTPNAAGDLVRFVDVEAALRRADLLDWVLPIVNGNDDTVANHRTQMLAAGLARGLRGVDLVEWAKAHSRA